MASSTELINQRQRYYTLRDNVSNLITNFSSSIESMGPALKINECFTIDENSADGGKISSINSSIVDAKNKLSNEIIPAINEKIRSLNVEIQNALDREEAERRREEEARNAASTSSSSSN